MVNELSAVFLDSVANPDGGVVAPVDVKVAVTETVLGPTHAGIISVVESLM